MLEPPVCVKKNSPCSDLYVSVFHLRLVSRAQTSLRCHGELGPQRLCGAEDPAGCGGVVLVVPDGVDHGGCSRDLPPGRRCVYVANNLAIICLKRPQR